MYDGRGDISPDFDRDYKALKKVENKEKKSLTRGGECGKVNKLFAGR